jgi:zinc protease
MRKVYFGMRVALGCLLATVVCSAQSRQAHTSSEVKLPTIRYEKYKLANGLDVILSKDHSIPLVSVNIWYHVGPANERPGRTGFAHLFEHMMFQGSQHVEAKAFDRYLEAAGATDDNGTTGFDRTNYYETVPSSQLELALWLESDRMGFLLPMLDGEKLANQRDVVRNERRETTENVPYGLVEEEIYHQLFPAGHPYYANVIGSHADVEAARLTDVREFFRQYYIPNNASLAIVGDFDPARVKSLVEKYFGSIPAGPAVPKIDVKTPAITSQKRAMVTDDVELPRVYMAWITPPIYQPGEAETNLLAQILGRGRTSRLYRDLVYRRQIAQDVDAENEPLALGSVFVVHATARPGVKPEDLERAMDEDIRSLQVKAPTEEELREAVNVTESGMVEGLETFNSIANTLNEYNHYLGDPGYVQKDFLRYERATPSGIKRVADEELRPEASVVIYGVPGKKIIQDVPRAPLEEARKPSAPGNIDEGWRASPPQTGPAHPFRPVPQTFKLRNGLSVLLIERHSLPLVSANLLVVGGAAANPADKPGLASFTTDMLKQGTRSRTAPAFADDIDKIGANLNVDSDYDRIAVSLETLTRNVGAGFGLMSDAVLHPAFDDREVERRRAQRLTDLLEEQDSPGTLRTKALAHALYGDGPYGYDIRGTAASEKSISRDDLVAFWKRNFTPSGSALVISGDLTPAQARELAERYFGSWKGDAAAIAPPAIPAVPQRAIYIIDKPGAPQTSLAIGGIGAPRATPDYTAMEIMNLIFGGSFSSRVNMNLREVHGYTYGEHSVFSFRRGAGPFTSWAGIRTDVTAPALGEVFREIDRIRDADVAPDELAHAKASWSQSLAGNFETTSDAVDTLSDLFVYGLPLDYYGSLPAQIEAVTAADVRRVALRYLKPKSLVVVAVGDRARIEPEIEKLGLGPVQVLP